MNWRWSPTCVGNTTSLLYRTRVYEWLIYPPNEHIRIGILTSCYSFLQQGVLFILSSRAPFVSLFFSGCVSLVVYWLYFIQVCMLSASTLNLWGLVWLEWNWWKGAVVSVLNSNKPCFDLLYLFLIQTRRCELLSLNPHHLEQPRKQVVSNAVFTPCTKDDLNKNIWMPHSNEHYWKSNSAVSFIVFTISHHIPEIKLSTCNSFSLFGVHVCWMVVNWIAANLPDMWDRTITIGSAGKTFSVTGWKLGWSIGPKHLIRALCIVHQNCN